MHSEAFVITVARKAVVCMCIKQRKWSIRHLITIEKAVCNCRIFLAFWAERGSLSALIFEVHGNTFSLICTFWVVCDTIVDDGSIICNQIQFYLLPTEKLFLILNVLWFWNIIKKNSVISPSFDLSSVQFVDKFMTWF